MAIGNQPINQASSLPSPFKLWFPYNLIPLGGFQRSKPGMYRESPLASSNHWNAMQSHDQNSATWSINNVIFALTLLHTNTALIPMLQLPLARINLNFRPTAQPLSCGVQTKFVPRGGSSSSANLAHISGNLSFQTLGHGNQSPTTLSNSSPRK